VSLSTLTAWVESTDLKDVVRDGPVSVSCSSSSSFDGCLVATNIFGALRGFGRGGARWSSSVSGAKTVFPTTLTNVEDHVVTDYTRKNGKHPNTGVR